MTPHPLDPLSIEETCSARDIVKALHPGDLLSFRQIYLEEPLKCQLTKYLKAEHGKQRIETLERKALVQYDVIGINRVPTYHESIIDLHTGERAHHVIVSGDDHINLTM